jgi:uncharacterized damage-inducible protein DinB
MQDITRVLVANLDEAYSKKGWHGTNLRGSLRGLSVEEVVWRPGGRRHNIWELTAHAAYWKYAVRRRLRGDKRGSFVIKGNNWFPSPEKPEERGWRELLRVLDNEHAELRTTIAALSARAVSDPKTARLVYGIAAHDLYHTGQIQLIKRLVRM